MGVLISCYKKPGVNAGHSVLTCQNFVTGEVKHSSEQQSDSVSHYLELYDTDLCINGEVTERW